MTQRRVAMVGCGHIADFYVPALRAAGLEVTAVCSRPGSVRLEPFAERHSIPHAFEGVDRLLDARDLWDGGVLAPPIDDTLPILERFLATGARVLVEKPVATRSADLATLTGRGGVLVGYNRRFYPAAREARALATERGPAFVQLVIPEAIQPDPDADPADIAYMEYLFTNSVHALDLLRFVVGDVRVDAVRHLRDDLDRTVSVAAVLVSDRGDVVQLSCNWGASANFAFVMDWGPRRYEMRPLEVGTHYEGLDVEQPTADRPLRVYRPKELSTIVARGFEADFKPGFLGQAQELARLLQGEEPTTGATLTDAHAALALAEALAGRTFQGSATRS